MKSRRSAKTHEWSNPGLRVRRSRRLLHLLVLLVVAANGIIATIRAGQPNQDQLELLIDRPNRMRHILSPDTFYDNPS